MAMIKIITNRRFFTSGCRVVRSAVHFKNMNLSGARLMEKTIPRQSDFQACVLGQRSYSQNSEPEPAPAVDIKYVERVVKDGKVLIIDVREPEELKDFGFIPTSINIPLGSVSSVLGTMSDKEFKKIYKRNKPSEDCEVIFYCMVGKRSGMAQHNAMNLGYKNAKNYLGSWVEWASKHQQ